MNDVIVFCTNCLTTAPWDPPDLNNRWGIYHWHQPCPFCGAEAWAAHDTSYDLRTGRRIKSENG